MIPFPLANTMVRASRILCLLILACLPVAQAAEPVSADDLRQIEQAERLVDSWPDQEGALSGAQRIIDDLLARNPAAGDAYRIRAMILMRDGYLHGETYEPEALERAERSVDEAIAKSPDNDRAYVLRADLYRLTGRADRAREDLRRAESLKPDNPWIQFEWSDLLFADKQPEQAAERCREGLKRRPDDIQIKVQATECLIRFNKQAGHLTEVEKLYREQIAMEPTRAWPRGNFAEYLLCLPDRYDDSIEQARAAIALLDYGIANRTLAAGLYRRWAAQVLAGQKAAAEDTWREAQSFGRIDVAGLIEQECGGRPLLDAMLALRATGRAKVYAPADAVRLAIGAYEDGGRTLPGVFQMEVVATGRSGDDIFLNSMPDYRDPRCLTIRLSAKRMGTFRERYGVDPDVYFKGKTVTVVGVARRVKIEIFSPTNTAESHYFQTQIGIFDIDQIKTLDEMPQGLDKG